MQLSKLERLLLSYQLRILEALYPEEADYYSQHRKAVEQGYSLNYEWMTEHLHDEMSEEKCREVIDIMDMYRAITFSAEKISDSTLQKHHYLRFRGFDGNEETCQMAYARYWIEDLGRFPELRYGMDHPDLNSHRPMLNDYRKMLKEWTACKQKHDLSDQDIRRILDAAFPFHEH